MLEHSLFAPVNKINKAIELLKRYEPSEGYYVCFSGGKDFVVILDLVKRAGVKFEAHHHILTIEQPELMQFIFKQYPEVINAPPKSMYQLIKYYGYPPLRQARFCCSKLKATGGNGRIKVTGVRAAESFRLAKRQKIEDDTKNIGGRFLHLIFDWSSDDVWQYIHKRNLPYCKLYDEGKKRIGCVFCPFARESENIENALKYPQFVRYFVSACDRAIKSRLANGKYSKYKTDAKMFIAWIEDGRGKKLKDFGVIFDYEKGIFVMENNVNSVVKVATSQLLKISLVDFNTIILHAKKINRGQLDFADILRAELKNKLGIDNAEPLINSLQKNKELPAHRQAFSFLAQSSNFIIEGTNTNYHLVKFSDDLGACGLDEIDKRSVDKMVNNSFKSGDTTTLTTANENTTTIPAENSNVATPAPTLAQRVIKIQFHLQNMANSAIIIGQELIECKKEVGHGNWANWLKENFNLSQNMAGKFMAIADRFGNSATSQNLNKSQMMEMLSLPTGEEENFIAEKAAEGVPVENMTVKQLRAEIKDWKKKAEDIAAKADNLKKENDELKNKPPQVIETVKTMLPPGYVETIKRVEELQQQVDHLLEQNQDLQNQVIDSVSKQPNTQIEFATPADYDDIKKQLAILQAEKDTLKIDTAFLQALNQFFMAANFLHQHQDRAEHNLRIFFDDDPLTTQRVIQISDIANIFNNIIKKLSN